AWPEVWRRRSGGLSGRGGSSCSKTSRLASKRRCKRRRSARRDRDQGASLSAQASNACPGERCGAQGRGVLGGAHRSGARGFQGRDPTINASIALDTKEALEMAEGLDRLRKAGRLL